MLRAFGPHTASCPSETAGLARDQHAFWISDSGLARDGKVVSVRLALFAEMVKGKPWTPATLREVGGTEGVGLTFLEETFSAPQASRASPSSEGSPRGSQSTPAREPAPTSRGRCGRRPISARHPGTPDRPRDFAELIHILDNELRLITPTEPERWR